MKRVWQTVWLSSSLVLASIIGFTPAHAAPLPDEPVKVQVNDELVHFPEQKPYIDEESKLHVPIRIMTDKLGYNLAWAKNNDQVTITINNGSKTVSMTTGHNYATVDGKNISLDAEANFHDGAVFVPFRFVSEALGIRVQWDSSNRIAILNQDGSYHAPVTYAPQVEKVIESKATAYTAASSENGGAGPVDYFGNPLRVGTVSVDPSIIPLGSKLYIEGYSFDGLPSGGMFAEAVDTGGSIKGNKIDIFVPVGATKAKQFGIQQVKIFVLKP